MSGKGQHRFFDRYNLRHNNWGCRRFGFSDPSLDGGDFCIGKKDLAALGVVFVGVPFSIVGAIGGAATKTTDNYLFSDSIKN